ncbi:glycosyltransferase family 39 protein, partial [Candidatus Woesearchaeota archaeon]|nr:glycosyltransferase family 39 protein [Candidatus Woesearchaeota archaeon]
MKTERHRAFLAIILLVLLAIRVFLMLQTANFSDSTSYFHLRQIKNIIDSGKPIFQDNLSYSGRFYLFLPFFHYLVAFFGLFIRLELASRLILTLLFCLVSVIVYGISFKISKDRYASLLAALLAGFSPVIYFNFNTLSTDALVLPLTFLLLYQFMRVVESNNQVSMFVLLIILLALSSAYSLLVVVSLLTYLLFLWLQGMRLRRVELELIVFSSLFITWLYFVLFKTALLEYGTRLIYHNIPPQLILEYFPRFSLLGVVYLVGVLPTIGGVFMAYRYLFVEKNRDFYLLAAFGFTVLVLVLLRYVQLVQGLTYHSVVACIFFAPFFQQLSKYFRKTRFTRYSYAPIVVFLLLFLTTSML